jgi:hypothetical protein
MKLDVQTTGVKETAAKLHHVGQAPRSPAAAAAMRTAGDRAAKSVSFTNQRQTGLMETVRVVRSGAGGYALASAAPYARFVIRGTSYMAPHPVRFDERHAAREAAAAMSTVVRRA